MEEPAYTFPRVGDPQGGVGRPRPTVQVNQLPDAGRVQFRDASEVDDQRPLTAFEERLHPAS